VTGTSGNSMPLGTISNFQNSPGSALLAQPIQQSNSNLPSMNHPGGPQIGYQQPPQKVPFQPRMLSSHSQIHTMPGSLNQPNVRRPMQQQNPQGIHNVFQDTLDGTNIHQQSNMHIPPANL
jgi:Ca2+-dependent lipid-binding protein